MTMAPDPVSCPGPAGLFLPGLRNGKVLADPLYPMKHLPATQQWPKQGSQTVWKGLMDVSASFCLGCCGPSAGQSLSPGEQLVRRGLPCAEAVGPRLMGLKPRVIRAICRLTGCRSNVTAALKKKTVITIASLTLTFMSKSGHSRLSGGLNYIIAPRPEIHLGLNNVKNF